MSVTFEIPEELRQKLAAETPDLGQAAKEAFALELFRREKISHPELAKLLGLSSYQTSSLLQRHKIYAQSMTMEEIDADVRTLERVLGPVKR